MNCQSNYNQPYNCYNDDYYYMNHNHEFESSTKLAEQGEDRHNHRTAGITGKAMGTRENHVHEIMTFTDSLDHIHKINVLTGPALRIPGTNKHIHLVSGNTNIEDQHCHAFLFTTQIQSPLV